MQQVFEQVMEVIERNPPTYTEFSKTQAVSTNSQLVDNNRVVNQPSAPTLGMLPYTSLNLMSAQIVDQFIIQDVRKVPPTSRTYHSLNQKNDVILATAKTISGRLFTVQRLMIGQLNKNFATTLGFHSLGKLLSFVSGDHILIFGYPMESSKHKDCRPTMMGFWIAIEGDGVRPINFQQMRILFSENCILCAVDESEQFLLEMEITRRRLFNNQEMPGSPLSFEPARSPPDCVGGPNSQPVILYSPTFIHPNFVNHPLQEFKPFVDTVYRKRS